MGIGLKEQISFWSFIPNTACHYLLVTYVLLLLFNKEVFKFFKDCIGSFHPTHTHIAGNDQRYLQFVWYDIFSVTGDIPMFNQHIKNIALYAKQVNSTSFN